MTYGSAFILLFLVMDPIGNIPIFAAALSAVKPEKRIRVVIRELLIALAVLIAFLFGGPASLRLMGISPAALEVGGAIVLFLIALHMVFPPEREAKEGEMGPEPFIVPLAIPLIAGPGAIATLLLIVGQPHDTTGGFWDDWGGRGMALAALLSAWGASAVILLAASALSSRLGTRAMQAMERLMGMLLEHLHPRPSAVRRVFGCAIPPNFVGFSWPAERVGRSHGWHRRIHRTSGTACWPRTTAACGPDRSQWCSA